MAADGPRPALTRSEIVSWQSSAAIRPQPNFGVKLSRPGFGPAAELPAALPARRRHGGCSSPLGSANVIGGNRRAAPASARGTGRAAYTKDVSQTGGRGAHRLLRSSSTAPRCAGGIQRGRTLCMCAPPVHRLPNHQRKNRCVLSPQRLVGLYCAQTFPKCLPFTTARVRLVLGSSASKIVPGVPKHTVIAFPDRERHKSHTYAGIVGRRL
jgi:hypothetical protein